MAKTIGVVYHPQRDDSAQLAEQVQRSLKQAGHLVHLVGADDDAGLGEVLNELDLIITLGGDGTIVRTVRLAAGYEVPVLGVNLGRLGFLAELEPDDLRHGLERIIKDDYIVEDRLLMHATVLRGDDVLLETDAVNDVVVARGRISRVVHVAIEVDHRHVMTASADGVIVSTPTGSTAYCLAAGGPIVAPGVAALTITPVAAHLSIAHALVIPAERHLCLQLTSGSEAIITIDGHHDLALEVDDRVICTASQRTAKFVRFGDSNYFYETVLRRLRWPDRRATQ